MRNLTKLMALQKNKKLYMIAFYLVRQIVKNVSKLV